MLSFRDTVRDDFEAVNQLIIDQLHSEVGLVENIGHYLIKAGGKRLRPLLVLLAAKACNYSGRRHIDLAVIIEFIHTATLLHDDVVDTSELRRGRFTANAQWGNAPSVLVGDFLYSRAFQMMVGLGNLDVMRILADTTNIISEGEVQQLVNIGDPNLSESAYLQVIGSKTAQLFKGAGHSAALLGETDAETCAALSNYGWHLGLAFQLIDDALDYTSDNTNLGKNTGDDLAEGKMTLPIIQAMRCGSEAQNQLLRKAIQAQDGAQLPAVIDIIKDTASLDYTFAAAKEQARQAKQCLNVLPPSKYHSAMLDLADFAVDRSY
jgi:octaprenyl-diphosphate synthase